MELNKVVKARLLVLILLIITQIGCNLFTNEKTREVEFEYSEISKIKRDNEEERIKVFNQYSIEKQIEIFLYAMHQRDYVFEVYLIKNGEPKAPKIAEEIKSQDYVRDKVELMGIILRIDRNCEIEKNNHCIANNTEIMETLKQGENSFQPTDDVGDKMWKKNYSWILFELQRIGNPKIQNAPNPYSNSNTNQTP